MTDKRYQIFISSTFSDLQDERRKIWQQLTDLNYIVAGMETFPSSSDQPFEYIRPIIEQSDFFVLIVGARYGSIPDGVDISYTEMEFDYATSLGIPVLAFLPAQEVIEKASKTDRDPAKEALLESFKARIGKGRMVRYWADAASLAGSVVQAAIFEERRKPRPGWVRGADIDVQELLVRNRTLTERIATLESELAPRETLSVEEMHSALRGKLHFPVAVENKEAWVDQERWRLIAILEVFDGASYEAISNAMRLMGRGRFKPRPRAEDVVVGALHVDTIALELRRYGIIEFDVLRGRESIRPGPNWLLAHDVARQVRSDLFAATGPEDDDEIDVDAQST